MSFQRLHFRCSEQPLLQNGAPPFSPPASDWIIWQLADSAFPTGGFAHSGGLEAAYQNQQITNRDQFLEFLDAALTQAGSAILPFVHEAWLGEIPLPEIDWTCNATTSNHVANRASRAQGQALLASAERAFQQLPLKSLRQQFLSNGLPGHNAVVFGAISKILSIPKLDTSRLFLFTQLRGWISSSVRLGIIGPGEAQAIQSKTAQFAEAVLSRSINSRMQDVAQTAPLLELFQGTQDRLYSRLFQS
ncbi:MAG: urease accessory UreF family protein [Verrucomicrobiota bacterium]|nr:urease accessory UreF family protein [Verrucomicrobiota bacterium]